MDIICNNCGSENQFVCDNCGQSDYRMGNSSQVNVVASKPIFLIDINWHPEYNIEADWKEYTIDNYMQEFDSNVDCINAMMRVGRIILKAC